MDLLEFKFDNIYKLADIVDNCVKAEIQIWNYNEEYFINSATKFSKDTLLHLYIVTTAFNHYHRYFRKDGDMIDEVSIEEWYLLFENYNINIEPIEFDDNPEPIDWFENNSDKFAELFNYMAEEVFYILFANRQFLLEFNNLIALTVKETNFPTKSLNEKGTIKRAYITKWVKTAVYHREKGRCVFCNTDLTGLVNTLTNANYDHIVPLDKYGTNDPCNIQLACESCNKSKSNKGGTTSNLYIPWW
ncbi:MAG: hypothetical protein GQ564_04440 [Bacteroidales bacterium]|nr:hypothetical protein [Bacteroidales bacterium]